MPTGRYSLLIATSFPTFKCATYFEPFMALSFMTWLLQVEDLHSITPNHFLEVSGAVIHPLSYQQVKYDQTFISPTLIKNLKISTRTIIPLVLRLSRFVFCLYSL